MIRKAVALLVVWFSAGFVSLAEAQTPIPIANVVRSGAVSFDKEILPILRKNCLACHSASEANAELVLETPAGILKGGESGPAAVAGKGAESLLIQLASHQKEPVMPPAGNDVAAVNLTSQELGLIKLWIDQGAQGSGLSGVISPEKWRPLPAGTHPIFAAALTADGQFAACGRANQIFIYHVPTGQLVTRLTDPSLQAQTADDRPGISHLDVVQSLAFSKQGDRLASGGFREVKIWRSPRDVRRLTLAAADAIGAVAVSPDKKWIATGGVDRVVKLWNAETGAAGPVLTGHTDAVTSLQFSRDGAKLYSGSLDKSILIWSLPTGTLAGRIATAVPIRGLATVEKPLPMPVAAAPAAADAATTAAPAAPPTIEMLVSGGDNFVRLWQVPESLPTPLSEHLAKGTVLAVNHDRSRLAVANDQGQVQIRDLSAGKILKTWPAHAMAIRTMAFAPPPKPADPAAPAATATQPPVLATAGADQFIRLWNAETGEPIAAWRASLLAIESLTFRPDGKRLLAGAADGGITEWDLEKGISAPLAETGPAAQVAATSPDGKLLATANPAANQPAIVVRDVASGKIVATLMGHGGPVLGLTFSADSRRIVSGAADKSVRVWDWLDGKFPQVATFAGHPAAVRAVAFNADATQVFSGADDGSLKLWAVADGKEAMNFPGHTAAIVGVAIAAGNVPVSASADKTVRFWNPANGQATRSLTDTGAITSLAISRDSATLAIGTAENKVKLHRFGDGAVLFTLAGHAAPPLSLAFSVDNTRLVSAAPADAMVWRVADGRLLEIAVGAMPFTSAQFGAAADTVLLCDAAGSIRTQSLRFAMSLGDVKMPVTSVAYRADGQLAFASSIDGTVRGFTMANGQPAFTANHGAAVHQLALSPNEQTLASAGEDKQIKLWNAGNGAANQPAALAGFTGPVQTVSFAAGGNKIVGGSGGTTPEMLVFGLPDGGLEQSLPGHATAIEAAVAIGEASDRLISVAIDGVAIESRLLAARRVAGHTAPVTSLASAGGMFVLSGSDDGTLRKWDLANEATPLALQLNHGAPITAVAVRGDGQRFASTSSNMTTKLWNATNSQQLAEMRGDMRAKATLARLTQDKADGTAKVAAAKTASEAADREVPVKTTVEQQAAAALATATADVTAKLNALTVATNAKVAAEQAAITAAATATAAAKKMEDANQLALNLAATARLLTEKAAQATAVAQTEPQNQALAKVATDATTAATAAATEARTADAAKAPPTQAAQAAAQIAGQAATQALNMAKPATDAAAALATSEAAQRAAKLAHDVAARELKIATDAAPLAKMQLAKAEAALKQIDVDLAVAVKADTDSQQPIRSVAFSPDGRLLATGGDFSAIHTWDSETGKAVASYVGHTAAVPTLAFLSDAELVSGSLDKAASVWRLNPDWELERTIGSLTDPAILIDRVVAVDFSHNGKLLATGGGVPSRSGEVKIWNVADGSPVHSLPDAHNDGVNAVSFSADDTLLASAGADKFVKKWEVATGKQRMQFEGHTNHVLSVSWRANGATLASSGVDGSIQIWNAETGDRPVSITGYTKAVSAVKFVGQSPIIVSCSGDRLVRMHNSDNGGVTRDFPGSTDYLYCVDATPDATVVIAGGHDGLLRIWNGTNSQLLHTLGPPLPPQAPTAAAK